MLAQRLQDRPEEQIWEVSDAINTSLEGFDPTFESESEWQLVIFAEHDTEEGSEAQPSQPKPEAAAEPLPAEFVRRTGSHWKSADMKLLLGILVQLIR